MLLLVLSTLAVAWTSYRLADASGLTSPLERVAAVLVGVPGLVLLDAFVVGGALRALRPVPLLLAALLQTAVVELALAVRSRRGAVRAVAALPRTPVAVGAAGPGSPPPPSGPGGGSVALEDVRERPRVRDAARALLPELLRSPTALVLTALVGAQLAYRLVVADRLPVLDWDGLWYHLTMVDRWVQDGAITRVPEVIWSDAYPANTELGAAWVATFLHSTRLATFTQLSCLPLGLCAVALLARRAGATPRLAVVAGLAFLATPLVYVQSTTMFVDVSFTVCLLATWAFGTSAVVSYRAGERATAARFAYAGVAGGLALGAKGTGPIAVGLLGLVLGGLVVVRARQQAGAQGWGAVARGLARPVVLFTVPLLALGTPWYIRNLVLFHNPVWPFAVGPFPGLPEADVVLSTPPELRGLGLFDQLWTSWTGDLSLGREGYWYSQDLGGFGLQWLFVLLPCLVLLVAVLVRRGRTVLAALLLPAVLMLALQPHPWWSRFTLFLPAVGAVALAVVASRARRLPAALLVGAFLVLAGSSMWTATARANWPIGPAGDEFVPVRQVAGLLRLPAAQREAAGFWKGWTQVRDLPRGTVVAVPWDLTGTRPPCCVMMHPLVGDDLRVTLRALPRTDDLAGLLAAAHRAGAQDVLVLKGSPTEALLQPRPDLALPVGDAGWLARVFRLSPQALSAS